MTSSISLINSFCDTLDTKYLTVLDYDTKKVFRLASSYVLKNKVGKQEIAKIVYFQTYGKYLFL